MTLRPTDPSIGLDELADPERARRELRGQVYKARIRLARLESAAPVEARGLAEARAWLAEAERRARDEGLEL